MPPRERFDPEPATVGTGRNGHAPDGRFAPGNSAATGRKSRTAWRDAFDKACSPSDLEAIARRAVRDARKGDRFAREWIGQFALQRPSRLIDVTTHEDESRLPSNDPGDDYYL